MNVSKLGIRTGNGVRQASGSVSNDKIRAVRVSVSE